MSNFTLNELKLLKQKIKDEIENAESSTTSSKHAGGRPKKNTVFKKTEIRMEPELYANLCILAELDRRSTNGYICKILEEHINQPEIKDIITKKHNE